MELVTFFMSVFQMKLNDYSHFDLTSLCEDHLAATAALPIALLPIQDQENPVWQQCLEVVSNLKGPHFHAGMTSLARYA
jgi:hypothetical protein